MYRSDYGKRKDLPSVSAEEMKLALRQLASGVSVVTAELDGELYGITVSSFVSISLDPPIVMISINDESPMSRSIVASEHFAVHILSSDQSDLADRFARKVPGHVKYGELEIATGPSGAPTFEGTLAVVDCVLERTVHVATHTVMFGRIVRARSVEEPGSPLIYYHRSFRGLAD